MRRREEPLLRQGRSQKSFLLLTRPKELFGEKREGFMPARQFFTALKRVFGPKPVTCHRRLPDEHRQTLTWREAQEHERGFWIQYIRHELGLTSRDQLVGFRLCEGRVHLCQFGLEWHDWMYSMHPPFISGRLLDVGSSVVSQFEKCRSVSVVAIDPLLEELARYLPEIVVMGNVNNCEYRCCRIQDVQETNFDIVWCYNVLDHTDDWEDIIHHSFRVLKKSALLFLATDVRSDEGLLDAAHISAFTANQLVKEIAVSGFEVIWQSPRLELPQYRFVVRAFKP